MKKYVMLLSALLLLPALAYADSIDDAEAKQRGVSVEQVQLEHAKAKIKLLEAKIEELNKKLALAESSKVTPATPFGASAPPASTQTTVAKPLGQTPTNPNAKKVVLPMFDYYRLPVFLKYFHTTPGPVDYVSHGRWASQGAPLGFTAVKMDAPGYLTAPKVVSIIDDSTALVEVDIYNPATGLPNGTETKTLLIEGMPTTGQTKDSPWTLKTWFKIVATRKINGTPYFVADEILPAVPFDATHPRPLGQ